MKKFILIPVVLFAVAALISSGCSAQKTPPPAGAMVLVATAVATNLPMQIQPPPVGHVMAYTTVTIHSQIQGLISRIYFRQGQEVREGDPLFLIDPRPSQAALDQARANLQRDSGQLEYQKASYARELKLLQSKIISQDEIDTDKASLDAATGTVAADEAAIANALLNLEFCHINSPVDGLAGGLQSYVGNVVKAPDDTLVTINQIHPIYVAFSVPEQYLPQIKREMRAHPLQVSAHFENMDVSPPQGRLTFIDNSVDTTTGTIQLRGTFPNNNDALWPGQFVTVDLTLSQLTNAIVVPTQAVQTGQNGEFVYVVKPDKTVEERPVTIGIAYGGETEIEQGVLAGETVVTDGQLRLAPGMLVNVKSAGNGTAADGSAPHSMP